MLSRRLIVMTLLPTGKPCVPAPTAAKWQARMERYGAAEVAMGEAKLLYAELVQEDHVTRAAAMHFVNLRAMSDECPEAASAVRSIVEDVDDKRRFSECFDI